MVMARVQASPVYWAGASLKRTKKPQTLLVLLRFPGLLGRGLIEAAWCWRASTGSACFPGLLGRGLIEASRRAAPTMQQLHSSPVYWAGASLKRYAVGVLFGEAHRLPRSTGPGPH